ncbi:hypothetical protein ACT8ZV_02585 [Nocardioides sp. MAHUQ-72]|uniref:hypothetical protein n=1 Tax=unclassified Nocardioides TaxID=2615069 RepID=UPI00361A9C45
MTQPGKPDEPGEPGKPDEHGEERDEQGGQGGQVSEVSGMDPADADTPIADDQATAGYPESESGSAQEGEAGPNAVPADNRRAAEGD